MVSFKGLREDHEKILDSLNEIYTLIDNKENMDIEDFSHQFNRLHDLIDSHEKREEKLFKRFKRNDLNILLERFVFEHRELRGHKKVINDAIKSNDKFKVAVALETDGFLLIDKLKRHISMENEMFDRL